MNDGEIKRPAAVDFGRPVAVLRAGTGRLSGRVDVRVVAVVAVLLALTFVAFVVALVLGDYQMPVDRVLTALFGTGTPRDEFVMGRRLPRALLAVLLGAALGISGAIIQSLTRNPLGSPDVIGFNTGAYTGALLVIVVFGGSAGYLGTSAGSLIGGIATALIVYLLAYKQGVQGFRLIVVGIGVSAMLASLNTWLILTADLDVAMAAAAWGAGTLQDPQNDLKVPIVALVFALVLVLLVPLSVRMKVMEMGDDAATALGVRTERTRLILLVLGVSLTALATAAAGPIAFVALAAPQLAKRLAGSAGVSMLPAAAMGALLLSASDLVAQWTFSTPLPVGVVTVSVGGLYLVWLIARETKKN
ncbi:MAG: iron chelate uptake ABC transporter family permease subunit [Gordonia sp. (in: high G+C Gram-positive bacteria)]|uniref:FecCD family ABC transporter permease n=1 Tax=Gordonia sp. (in: high G+C Gram-positive bacteria) TaxID=84139 RepID=UPI0039E6E393